MLWISNCKYSVVNVQIPVLIQEPLPDQRSQIVKTSQVLNLHRSSLTMMFRRLSVNLNNQRTNCHWLIGPRSAQRHSRDLRREVGSRSWWLKLQSCRRVPTVWPPLSMPMKGCAVTEARRWWTVLLTCTGWATTQPRFTAVAVAYAMGVQYRMWLTSTSLLKLSYKKKVSTTSEVVLSDLCNCYC